MKKINLVMIAALLMSEYSYADNHNLVGGIIAVGIGIFGIAEHKIINPSHEKELLSTIKEENSHVNLDSPKLKKILQETNNFRKMFFSHNIVSVMMGGYMILQYYKFKPSKP